MKIQAKLVSFVSVALVVPLLLGIFYIRHFGRLYYQQQQGFIHLMVAEELTGTLQDGIRQKFEQVLNWVALGPMSFDETPVSPFSPETVQQVESKWKESVKKDGIQSLILSSPVSRSLLVFQQANLEFSEILMTDRYGRLTGATNPTTDYWQADEDWWKTASTLPAGSGVIQGLRNDESAEVLAIDMVFPVYRSGATNDFLGVLKASLHATRFLQRAAPRSWGGAIARDIIFPDGRVLAHIHSGDISKCEQIPEAVLLELLTAPEQWEIVELTPGSLSLAAAVPMRIMGGSIVSGEELKDTHELYVVVSRDLEEAMMPVHNVLRQLTVWSVIATFLIAVISYLLATFWFARPIKKLRNASLSFVEYIKQSEQGRFEDAWESRQKVRERMNDLETIRGRDELQGLSRDFLRMGERMLIFFRQIEERLTDKKQK